MRRVLGFLMVAGLLLTGAAACSKSDGDSPPATAPSGGTGGSTNPKIAAYCDAVDAYVAKVKAAYGDASKLALLAGDSDALSETSQALIKGGLDPTETRAVSACTNKALEALNPD